METMTGRGRAIRLLLTLVVGALTVAGTLIGDDDHFPFAPFRMFSTADKPNEPIKVLRTDGVDTTGARFELTERNAGVRRAEVEAQIERFKAEPALLRSVEAAYAARNPRAPRLVRVEIVEVQHHLRDAQPTGEVTEVTLAMWRP